MFIITESSCSITCPGAYTIYMATKNQTHRFPSFALLLTLVFITLIALRSSGLSLIITFIPGAIIAFIAYWRCSGKINRVSAAPLYFLALGWQLLHFLEEYLTDFNEKFPALIDGSTAYSLDSFIALNMVMYFLFILGGVFGLIKGIRIWLLPVWFFVVYGVCGNIITHVIFAVANGGYFPGLITAIGYCIIVVPLLKSFFVKK